MQRDALKRRTDALDKKRQRIHDDYKDDLPEPLSTADQFNEDAKASRAVKVEEAKKRKPSKDLVPWGIPFGTKEGEQLRAKILAKLRGEAADQSSYTEDARVRAEELERQMKIGVPASERG